MGEASDVCGIGEWYCCSEAPCMEGWCGWY